MRTALFLLLTVSGALTAPTETTANPFLEGLDSFLEAFGGLALPGDPLAETSTAEPATPDQETDIAPQEAHCLGCEEPIEADSVSLRKVARLAATLLEEQLNMTDVTAVTQVYRAAKQVVNGFAYFLTLELSPTNCSLPRLEQEQEEIECFVNTTAGARLFSVDLLQPPSQSQPSDAELLRYTEVSPEEVVGLPGLFAGPDPPPPPPSSTEEEPVELGIEADLVSLIDVLDAVPAAGDHSGAEDTPAAPVDEPAAEDAVDLTL